MPRPKKKKTAAGLANDVAEALQKLVRMKAADETGFCRCVTCGVIKHWKEMQGGHFISRGFSKHKLREENVHPQCRQCNGPLKGNQIPYTLYMQATYGPEFVEYLEATKKDGHKWIRYELEEQLAEFNEQIKIQADRLAGY